MNRKIKVPWYCPECDVEYWVEMNSSTSIIKAIELVNKSHDLITQGQCKCRPVVNEDPIVVV